MSGYIMLMGCVTWFIALAALIGQIMKIVNSFKDQDDGLTKCKHILNAVAIATMGVALGILFFQVSYLIK